MDAIKTAEPKTQILFQTKYSFNKISSLTHVVARAVTTEQKEGNKQIPHVFVIKSNNRFVVFEKIWSISLER